MTFFGVIWKLLAFVVIVLLYLYHSGSEIEETRKTLIEHGITPLSPYGG